MKKVKKEDIEIEKRVRLGTDGLGVLPNIYLNGHKCRLMAAGNRFVYSSGEFVIKYDSEENDDWFDQNLKEYNNYKKMMEILPAKYKQYFAKTYDYFEVSKNESILIQKKYCFYQPEKRMSAVHMTNIKKLIDFLLKYKFKFIDDVYFCGDFGYDHWSGGPAFSRPNVPFSLNCAIDKSTNIPVIYDSGLSDKHKFPKQIKPHDLSPLY